MCSQTEEIAIAAANALLTTADGKDKLLKLLQYVLRIASTAAPKPRAAAIASTFSLARRIFRLGRWACAVWCIGQVMRRSSRLPPSKIAWDAVSAANDALDDLCCLCRLSIVRNDALAVIAAKYSSILWLASILHDLRVTSKSSPNTPNALSNRDSRRKMLLEILGVVKAYADLLFAAYDVFNMQFSPQFANACGAMAAAAAVVRIVVKTVDGFALQAASKP